MIFKGIIILQFIFVGCSTVSCPKKYMNNVNIGRYCELDYGAKWLLKKEYYEKSDKEMREDGE